MLGVEVAREPKKPLPENVAKHWAKEGKEVDRGRLMTPKGFRVLHQFQAWQSLLRIVGQEFLSAIAVVQAGVLPLGASPHEADRGPA